MSNLTYSAKPSEVEKKWHLIDAQNLVLGRLASIVAKILRGKHKPTFTKNIDCGDNVVIINADKIHLTGKKISEKNYYWHTGYPGGIKNRTAKQIIEGEFPERILKKSYRKNDSKNSFGQRSAKKTLYI